MYFFSWKNILPTFLTTYRAVTRAFSLQTALLLPTDLLPLRVNIVAF